MFPCRREERGNDSLSLLLLVRICLENAATHAIQMAWVAAIRGEITANRARQTNQQQGGRKLTKTSGDKTSQNPWRQADQNKGRENQPKPVETKPARTRGDKQPKQGERKPTKTQAETKPGRTCGDSANQNKGRENQPKQGRRKLTKASGDKPTKTRGEEN